MHYLLVCRCVWTEHRPSKEDASMQMVEQNALNHKTHFTLQVLRTADPTVNLDADKGDGFSEGFGLLHSGKVRCSLCLHSQ